MIVKYTVHTYTQYEAISIAQNLAKSSGFKSSVVVSIRREAETEWTVSLSVSK